MQLGYMFRKLQTLLFAVRDSDKNKYTQEPDITTNTGLSRENSSFIPVHVNILKIQIRNYAFIPVISKGYFFKKPSRYHAKSGHTL